MGDDFGACAARLSGLAALLVGWTPGTFWDATPDELASVIAALAPQGAAPLDLDALMELHPDG